MLEHKGRIQVQLYPMSYGHLSFIAKFINDRAALLNRMKKNHLIIVVPFCIDTEILKNSLKSLVIWAHQKTDSWYPINHFKLLHFPGAKVL